MAVYIILAIITILPAFLLGSSGLARDVIVAKGGERPAVKICGDRRRLLELVVPFWIFLALFLVGLFRVGIGNDYYKYVEFINRITFDSYVPTEPGFNLLVKLCNILFGPENSIAVFGTIQALTTGVFLAAIKKSGVDFGWAFFLFMSLGYYCQSLNTIRYYMALALVLYGALCLMDRADKYAVAKFLAFILLASTFHKSALISIPIYLLAVMKWNRLVYFILAAGAASVYIISFFYMDLLLKLMLILYPSYEGTGLTAGAGSLGNLARCIAVLGISASLWIKDKTGLNKHEIYFRLNYIAVLLYGFCSFIPQISRIGYYTTVTHIFYIPLLVESAEKSIKDRRLIVLLKLGLLLAGIAFFLLFLRRAGSGEIGIVPYRSFLFTEMLDYSGTWD